MITRQAKQIAISIALNHTMTRLDAMSADSIEGLYDAISYTSEETDRRDAQSAKLAAYEAKRVGAHGAPSVAPAGKSTAAAPVTRQDSNAAGLAAYEAKLAARQAAFGAS